MSTLSALKWRYSLKHFSDKKVSQEQVASLIEAARLSASSYGLQPYQVWVVEDPDILAQLAEHAYGQPQITQCSHLIILANETDNSDAVIDRYFQRHTEQTAIPLENTRGYADHIKSALATHDDQARQQWAQQQAYIALGSLLSEAAMLRVDTCPMTGFDSAGINQVLGFDDRQLNACVICAIGYRQADAEQPAKVRIPAQEFAHFIP